MVEPIVYLADEPRIPSGAFVQGHRVREMSAAELIARGFSEAEAWSNYFGQFQSFRSPLRHVIENVVTSQVMYNKPLLSHEREWLRAKTLEAFVSILDRKGAAWLERHHGRARLEATRRGDLLPGDVP